MSDVSLGEQGWIQDRTGPRGAMGAASRGKVLASLGGVLIALGVCGSYVLESAGTDAAQSIFMEALELTSDPFVLLGLLLVLIGCCMLAAKLPPRRCLLLGVGLSGLTGTISLLGRSGLMAVNAYDWTASLLPPLLSVLPLAVLFLATGLIRGSRARKGTKPGHKGLSPA